MDDNREGTVKLQIYNWKSQTYRDVEIHPSMNWGGKSLLGMTIRYDKHKINDKDMLHVTVYKNIFIYLFNRE